MWMQAHPPNRTREPLKAWLVPSGGGANDVNICLQRAGSPGVSGFGRYGTAENRRGRALPIGG